MWAVFAHIASSVQPTNAILLLLLRIHEKDGKIKSVEELLQAEILKVASKEKTVQVPISVPSNTLAPFCVYGIDTVYSLLHGIL